MGVVRGLLWSTVVAGRPIAEGGICCSRGTYVPVGTGSPRTTPRASWSLHEAEAGDYSLRRRRKAARQHSLVVALPQAAAAAVAALPRDAIGELPATKKRGPDQIRFAHCRRRRLGLVVMCGRFGLRLPQCCKALLCGEPVFGRERFSWVSGNVVAGRVRLRASKIISLGMEKGAGGSTKRHHGYVRLQERTNFIPETE